MNGPTIGHAWELNRGHKSVQGSISLKPCSAKTFLISPTSNHHRLSFPNCWRCLGGSWKLSPTVTPFPIPGLSIPSPVKTIDDEAGNPSANDDDVDGILPFPSLVSTVHPLQEDDTIWNGIKNHCVCHASSLLGARLWLWWGLCWSLPRASKPGRRRGSLDVFLPTTKTNLAMHIVCSAMVVIYTTIPEHLPCFDTTRTQNLLIYTCFACMIIFCHNQGDALHLSFCKREFANNVELPPYPTITRTQTIHLSNVHSQSHNTHNKKK